MKQLIAILLIYILIMINPDAYSDGLQIPIKSIHYNDGDWCEINIGIIYEKHISNKYSLLSGGYSNSLCNFTGLIGIEYQSGRLGFQVALATGYREISGMPVTPTGSIFYEFLQNKKNAVRLSAIPHKDGALFLSYITEF